MRWPDVPFPSRPQFESIRIRVAEADSDPGQRERPNPGQTARAKRAGAFAGRGNPSESVRPGPSRGLLVDQPAGGAERRRLSRPPGPGRTLRASVGRARRRRGVVWSLFSSGRRLRRPAGPVAGTASGPRPLTGRLAGPAVTVARAAYHRLRLLGRRSMQSAWHTIISCSRLHWQSVV